MKMRRKRIRIGKLANKLGVEPFVVRFWEKEFSKYLKPCRSDGGQRFYEEKDIKKFLYIKELLYSHGFTIAGAKKQLSQKKSPLSIIASKKTTLHNDVEKSTDHETLLVKLRSLRDNLTQLRELL